MNYLLVENLSKSFGEKVLFEDITFGIDKGQKTALIARNGSGKTSLLNIIAGLDIPDEGQVVVRKDIKIKYLPQEPQIDESLTVIDAIFNSDHQVAAIVKEYESALVQVETGNDQYSKKLEELTSKMDELDAWHFEAKAKEVLAKLDIKNFDQKCNELSGGQKKKIALAAILLDNADLIILDEPTNHLDVETIEWLEEYLNRMNLSLLLVTHDRYFLDQICDNIVEIDRNTIYSYKGDYSYYLEKKAEREQIEQVNQEKAKALYKKELEWIRRMPKARTTKSKSRIDAFIEVEEKAKQTNSTQEVKFFVKMERLGTKILEINNIHKNFDELKIVEDFSYIFKHGDKVGLVGKNGIGKSTFMELVLGNERLDKGKVVTGQTIKFAYFTQQGMDVTDDRRVIDIVKDVAEEVYVDDKHSISASRFLHNFGFDHNTQYNYLHNLSGGEKRKLHLLMTLMQQPNFLILDEPTNDLDIYTLQKLEEFLENYRGCLIVASHDRYFLDKICGHLFIFKGEGVVKDFYGNYTEYRVDKEKQERAEKLKKRAEQPKVKAVKPKDANKPSWKETKEHEQLETEIPTLEEKKDELIAQMNEAGDDVEKITKLSEQIGVLIEEIDQKTERWMELDEKISNYKR